MINKDLDKFANIARLMTGSNISTDELFNKIKTMNEVTKEDIFLKTNSMLKKTNLPFDKTYPLAKEGFTNLANEFDIDPAVLFQIYITKLGK